MALIIWRLASVFTARVFCVQAVAAHARVPKVLNEPEDLDAAVPSAAARASRFAEGVQVAQIARGDPFPPAAGSVPGVPAVHFVQADLFSRASPDVPQGLRFPQLAVWWEQLTVVALAAPNR
jgi:hypothetical protein